MLPNPQNITVTIPNNRPVVRAVTLGSVTPPAAQAHHGNGSPITNNVAALPGSFWIDDVDKTLWCVAGGAWTQLV